MKDRRQLALFLTLLGGALIVAAGVLTLQDQNPPAVVCIALGLVVALIGIGARRQAPAGPVAATPVDTDAVRAERETHGEVAAVRMLRTARPELSLLDATRIVRGL
jgi:hypothetical protein